MGTRGGTARGLSSSSFETLELPQDVYEGLEAVRSSGLTNMFDRKKVKQIAEMMGYDEAVAWLNQADSETYSNLMFAGAKMLPQAGGDDRLPVPEVRDKMKSVFAELRKRGFIARMNHLCCMNCASTDLGAKAEERELRRIAYWHRQDEEYLQKSGSLYIGYGWAEYTGERLSNQKHDELTRETGLLIADELKRQGVPYYWDGDPNQRILVNPKPDQIPKKGSFAMFDDHFMQEMAITDQYRDDILPIFRSEVNKAFMDFLGEGKIPKRGQVIAEINDRAKHLVAQEIGAGRIPKEKKDIAEKQVTGEMIAIFKDMGASADRPNPIIGKHRDEMEPSFKAEAEKIGTHRNPKDPRTWNLIMQSAYRLATEEVKAGRVDQADEFVAERQIAQEILAFWRR